MAADNYPPLCLAVIAEHERTQAGDPVILRVVLDDLFLRRQGLSFCEVKVTWGATGGRLLYFGHGAVLLTHGMQPDDYWVTATANDGYGHTVDCSIRVTITGVP
jgi:hypothetical protein